MTYQVPFTDSTNPAKPPLTINDGALNTQTSLTFPGRGYSGYAPIFAGDLLHLLENFAGPNEPTSPVQGQLWFDTRTGQNVLRVYSGTDWVEAGALKRAPYLEAPSVAASNIGDLWVDTTNSQLYLFSGASWLLVGPTYSEGLKTGPVVESIVDTQNISHGVISMYASATTTGQTFRIAIISKDAFTPKAAIDGYAIIKEGINLYSNDLTQDSALIWGTAETSAGMLVNNVVVPASNFLRKDISDTTNGGISIKNTNGLSIGTDLSFSISQSDSGFTVYSRNSSNNVDFNVNGNIVLHMDKNGKVGIGPGNINPTTALTVAGTITAGIAGTVGGLIVNNGSSPSPSTIFSATTAGVTSSVSASFSSNVTVAGQILISNTAAAGPVILPPLSANALYDIGSQTQPFRNVFADTFVGSFNGNFTGTVDGNVTGTAVSLKNATVFTVSGDIVTSDAGVSFTGQSSTAQAILQTVASTTLITGKPESNNSYAADQMLVYQSDSSGDRLVKVTKETFLSKVSLIPIGSIMPFAGLATAIPSGWLMCDGSEISSTIYNSLFNVIGYIYGAENSLLGVNSFKLPDLRGRFALGLDNMNNYGNIAGFTQVKDSSNNNVNTGGQIGAAGRVGGSTGMTLGGSAGSQNVVLDPTNVPNHSHTVSDAGHQHNEDQLFSQYDDAYNGTAPVDRNGNSFQYYTSAANDGDGDSGNPIWFYTKTATATTGITVGSVTGTSGQAANVMNPYLSINYIIYAGTTL